MSNLSANRRNSGINSVPSSPRPSVMGNPVSRMSSLNEEVTTMSDSNKIDKEIQQNVKEIEEFEPKGGDDKIDDAIKGQTHQKKPVANKMCSQRSDSGISDCSIHNSVTCSCLSLPSLDRRIKLDELTSSEGFDDDVNEYKGTEETDINANNNELKHSVNSIKLPNRTHHERSDLKDKLGKEDIICNDNLQNDYYCEQKNSHIHVENVDRNIKRNREVDKVLDGQHQEVFDHLDINERENESLIINENEEKSGTVSINQHDKVYECPAVQSKCCLYGGVPGNLNSDVSKKYVNEMEIIFSKSESPKPFQHWDITRGKPLL